MNYLIDSRRNALASEYVLGTLHGRARIRFQRLLMQESTVRHTLWRWESHLNALGGALPSQPLPAHVWDNIQTQLGFIQDLSHENSTKNIINFAQQPAKKWQWFTGLSAAAAIIFAVLLFSQPLFVPQSIEQSKSAQLAVVQSEKSQALWLIEINKNNISVKATAALQPQQDKDYELWLVAKDGRAPISLGLLPKQGNLMLPRKAIIDNIDIAVLAVSLEPLGGSPNGQPTQVVYSADVIVM